jgi:hypothetical protein
MGYSSISPSAGLPALLTGFFLFLFRESRRNKKLFFRNTLNTSSIY